VTIDSDAAKFSAALRSAIFWPVGIIFATAVVLLVLIVQLLNVVWWSDHSYEVLALTRKCEDQLVSTQNDVRGYLLTGDQDFVKNYNTERMNADTDLARLKQLVIDNPGQVQNADDVAEAKELWYRHADTMIAHRLQGLPTNPDWVRNGRDVLDHVREHFDKFTETEIALSDARRGRLRTMKTAMGICSTVLVLMLCYSVGYVVRRQMMVLATSYREALEAAERRATALARSEKDLEAQKEWLRVTLTSIGDGVIVTDPIGRVVLMNQEAERLTGWTQTEALHQTLSSIFRIVNEDTRATVMDPVEKVLREKKVVGLANHTVLISRTADEWPIEDSAAPICDANGTVLGVVLVFHDATDLRLAQKSLQAYSIELERQVADRTVVLQQTISELEVFSYSVSHDLRAPLRAMQGFSEALLEDYSEKLDTQGVNYLGRIKNAAGRLDRLTQDLLSYTRISRQADPLEVIDVDKVVRDTIQHDANLNPPAATVTIEGTLPKVMGHGPALNQVVANLLGNAVKFVALSTKPEVKVRAEDHGAIVRLWVEDNGIGIAAGNQQKIFDMFTQINDPSTYGGTGVGLAIVKKAMETMRGTVGVESAEGAGSRFWVELKKAL
jgi:PAS domain S-box-containing protein